MNDSEFSGADLSGRIVDRRFEVQDKLGEGGMGAIYRAKQLSMNRMVALKLLLRDRRGDPISAERFKHEAYLASRLRHPNAVVIYDFGQADDGLLYIAMELLTGQNLKECLQNDSPLGHERGSRIMLQTLRPIAQAHGMGLVHRDLKPANIFLTTVEGDPDFVKVLDFGVAKLTAVQDSVEGYQGGLTVAGKIYGTPNYMSPEQIRGKDVDQQSDLYSLGVIYYELLCGRRPFEAETPVDVMMMHLRDDPLPPSSYEPSIPSAVDKVALRALAKEPKDRFATAEEFIETIQSLGLGGSGAFGSMRSDRSGENFVPFGSVDKAPQDSVAEEVSITGLGFGDDEFDGGFQDEKTVLELDESVDADFSLNSLDIESEHLDRSERDTLFQSAADKSMKDLFDKIDRSTDGSMPDESSELGALDVDDFGLDEPSRLVPIPTAVPNRGVGAPVNPNKMTQVGYDVSAVASELNRQSSGLSSPPSPFGAGSVPPPATNKQSSDVPSSQNSNAPSRLAAEVSQAPLKQTREGKPIDKQTPRMVEIRHDVDEPTPPPDNQQWASAFANVNAGGSPSQSGRFAIPATAQDKKSSKGRLFAILLALVLISGSAAFFLLGTESKPLPSVVLSNANEVAKDYTVYISGVQMSPSQPRIEVGERDLSEKDVMVMSGDGSQTWEFKLPVIVESTELLVRFAKEESKVATLRVKGTALDRTLTVDGKAVSEPWVVIAGNPGKEFVLEKVVGGTPSRKSVKLTGGAALQIVEF